MASLSKSQPPKPNPMGARSIGSISSTQSSPSRSNRRVTNGVQNFVKSHSTAQAPATGSTFPSIIPPTSPVPQPNDPTRQPAAPVPSRFQGGNYEAVRVPVPDTLGGRNNLGMSMNNGMWGHSIGGKYGNRENQAEDDFGEQTDGSLADWNGKEEQSDVSYFQGDTFPNVSEDTTDLEMKQKQANYYDQFSDDAEEDTAQYDPPESPNKRPRLRESAIPKEENYYSDDLGPEQEEIQRKVEETKRRLSLERQHATGKDNFIGKLPQRNISTRSRGKTKVAAIRSRTPEQKPRSLLSTPESTRYDSARNQATPNGHSVGSTTPGATSSTSRKRHYPYLKQVDYQELATRPWHQPAPANEPLPRTPSPTVLYSHADPAVQQAYFAGLSATEFYDQRERMAQELKSILDDVKSVRERLFTEVSKIEQTIDERNAMLRNRRVGLEDYVKKMSRGLRETLPSGL